MIRSSTSSVVRVFSHPLPLRNSAAFYRGYSPLHASLKQFSPVSQEKAWRILIRNNSTSKVQTAEEHKRFEDNLHQTKQDIIDEATSPHFLQSPPKTSEDYTLPHPIWNEHDVSSIKISHKPPEKIVDYIAYGSVQTLRFCFDVFSGYKWGARTGTLDEHKWLTRIIFLETVAGVPGFVGAMVRHLHSLRLMRRDRGWIHTLLEEAENERMHLMTAMQLKKPGILFRGAVLFTQGLFTNFFFLAYLVSPRFCHKFVGYLEEEAVKTYTHLLEELEKGNLPMWSKLPAPAIAKKYWNLHEEALWKDVILAIRADEAHHRKVNHQFAGMKPFDQNPFGPGQ